METVKKILIVLFGVSWKTSLIGYLGGLAVAGAQLLQGRTEPGWMLLAFVLMALGRASKDTGVTGGSTPVTPEALNRVAPK